jgi:hypothetical protein
MLQSAGLPRASQAPVGTPSPAQPVADVDRRSQVGDELEETVLLVIPDPAQRRIRSIGGGPTNDVPEPYWRTLHDLFDRLDSPE